MLSQIGQSEAISINRLIFNKENEGPSKCQYMEAGPMQWQAGVIRQFVTEGNKNYKANLT